MTSMTTENTYEKMENTDDMQPGHNDGDMYLTMDEGIIIIIVLLFNMDI